MSQTWLILGSNLGDRYDYLNLAKKKLNELAGTILSQSSLYETEPWGFDHENQFINQMVILQTVMQPTDLLQTLKTIEKTLGREKNKERYAARTIDIDILFYDNIIKNTPELTIPHPEIPNRRFVLEPICELNAQLVHPLTGKTMATLLQECPDPCKVIKL